MTAKTQAATKMLGGVVDPELLRYWRTFPAPSNEVLACDLIEALLKKVPEGWSVVPPQMTAEMYRAFKSKGTFEEGYKAMLAAAPKRA